MTLTFQTERNSGWGKVLNKLKVVITLLWVPNQRQKHSGFTVRLEGATPTPKFARFIPKRPNRSAEPAEGIPGVTYDGQRPINYL